MTPAFGYFFMRSITRLHIIVFLLEIVEYYAMGVLFFAESPLGKSRLSDR